MEIHVQNAIRAGTSVAVLMMLTSAHHLYGAAIYDTPWRRHVVLPSILTILVVAGSLVVFCTRPDSRAGRLALWTAVAVTALFPIALIGVYEGVYNHALKDLLYFAGASETLLTRLFPPPMYEMPNDWLFEVSGVLQAVVAWLAARETYLLVKSVMDRGRESHRAEEPAASIGG
jgi:hypothetical protein